MLGIGKEVVSRENGNSRAYPWRHVRIPRVLRHGGPACAAAESTSAAELQMAGINSNYDSTLVRGDINNPENEGFCVFYLREGELIAVDCVARPKEFMAGQQLIAKGITPDAASLTDEQIEPASWLKS